MEICVEWWMTKWYGAPDERAIRTGRLQSGRSRHTGRSEATGISEIAGPSSKARIEKTAIRAGSRSHACSNRTHKGPDSCANPDDSDLPPRLAGAMGVKWAVPAPAAERRRRNPPPRDTGCNALPREHRPHVHRRIPRRDRQPQRGVHFRTYLIAVAANGGAEMHLHIRTHHFNTISNDSRGRAAPSCMQRRNAPVLRIHNEDGHAVGNRYR
jgi:hypothetical protein